MRHFALVCLIIVLGTLPGSAAQDAALFPEIRPFEIATLETMGQAMYLQDQLAWVATDIVIAERTEAGMRADGMRGWITIHELDRDVVRFVRLGDSGPEALYDVVFMEGAEPQLYSPATPILTVDELAQYRARELALENMEDTCSDRYNTIALRDPESDGWLVWALAATTDPDVVIIGGLTGSRFRLTASKWSK